MTIAEPIPVPVTVAEPVAEGILRPTPTMVWLTRLDRKLEELGVDRDRYRVRDIAEDAWCLVQEDERWAVFYLQDGERKRAMTFDRPDEAVPYLLGNVLLTPTLRRPGGSRTAEAPAAPERPAPPVPTPPVPSPPVPNPPVPTPPVPTPPVPTPPVPTPPVPMPEEKIASLPGEPPLSLFRERQMVELPTGTQVDRYGGPNGNVVYAARTPFPHRSLPRDWEGRPYHLYRLLRPLRVLTGTAVPWFEQPGGGTAYVLPGSLVELLTDGTLAEVRK